MTAQPAPFDQGRRTCACGAVSLPSLDAWVDLVLYRHGAIACLLLASLSADDLMDEAWT